MSRLCRNNFTLIFSLHTILPNDFLNVDDKGYPTGKFSHLFSYLFLDDYEKAKKNCRFIWSNNPGDYNPLNQTYDGALGLVVDGKAHIYARTTDYFSNEKYFDFTKPMTSIYYHSMSFINKKYKNQERRSLISLIDFLVPSFEYILILLFGFIIYWMMFNLIKIYNKKLNLKNSTAILSFLFTIFIFFMIQFFNSNLNTTNVIVSTDDLLSSKDKVLKSDREVCFLDSSTDTNYFTNSPPGTFGFKIYKKANKQNLCVFIKDNKIGNAIEKDNDKFFLIHYDFFSASVIRIFNQFIGLDTFQSEQLFENLRTFIISKKLDKKIKFFLDDCMTTLLEFGFSIKIKNSFSLPNSNPLLVFFNKSNPKLRSYFNLDEYINEYSATSPLKLNDLFYLFIIYFTILILISLTFILRYIFIFPYYLRYNCFNFLSNTKYNLYYKWIIFKNIPKSKFNLKI